MRADLNAQYMSRDTMPLSLRKDLLVPDPLMCTKAMTEFENIVLWFSSGGQQNGQDRSKRQHIIFTGITSTGSS